MNKTPKRIWIRSLRSGKVSVAEYHNAKRYNLIPPFKPSSVPEILKELVKGYPRQLVAVICRNDFNAEHVANVLEIPIEA